MSALEDVLREWLPTQRWYGGKGKAVAAVRVEHEERLSGGEDVRHTLLHVTDEDGLTELYQVLLGHRAGELEPRLAKAVVGEVDGRTLYDAVHDPEATSGLLALLAGSSQVGRLAFTAHGDLAMLQEFFRTASDGWELAKISVRDLYAEADLHADEVGGDFAGEAQRLGAATAEVHADLARALPTSVLGEAELAELAEQMTRRLEAAVAAVPALEDYARGLRSAFAALGAHEAGVPVQRVHGDYHLGQVLRTSHRWVVLDFEGEPAKPLAERAGLDSPVRDLAGMLRSFDYAARHLLADHPYEPHLSYRAEEWSQRNREAFCAGYADAGGPDPRADPVLLRAYEADKAVYEAVYEARNRPSWLPIPLASLARLTEGARS